MGLGIWTELCCDECCVAAEGEWADEYLPVEKLKSNAERSGWLVSEDSTFCSEECAQKSEKYSTK